METDFVSAAVLNLIRFPDRDPTGFCKSEPDPDWAGYRKKAYRIGNGYPKCIDHCRQMLSQRVFWIQTGLDKIL